MEIREEDFLMFVDRAFEGMLAIVEGLGEELANKQPDVSGANSPYATLVHCVGMSNYWVGNLIGNRQLSRDRASEFVATGNLSDLRKSVQELQQRIREDVSKVQGDQPLDNPPNPAYNPAPGHEGWTQGAVLMHVFEELAQHHGQMELGRDILLKVHGQS